MGCCTSHMTAADAENNLNEIYPGSPARRAPKRNFSIRNSLGSSGVYSRSSTPSRSLASGYSTASSRMSTPKAKTSNIAPHVACQNTPTERMMLSVCNDFDESPEKHIEQPDYVLPESDKSYGYFSESASVSKSGSVNNDSSMTTAPDQLLRTMDMSVQSDISHNGSDMESYMMNYYSVYMSRTSSPCCLRRDMALDYGLAMASPDSNSYQKWRNYLQKIPNCTVHNITNIPEAFTGHFSPPYFPAYTELDDMENAPKRFKVDVDVISEPPSPPEHIFTQTFDMDEPACLPRFGITHTMSTDL